MLTNSRTRKLLARVAAVTCAAVFASGCSNGGTRTSASSPPVAGSSSSAPAPSTGAPETTGSSVPPSSSTADITDTTGGQTSEATGATEAPAGSAAANSWFPLEPGYQSVRLGSLNRGHTELEHRRVFTVTSVTKVIDGVRARLVIDQDFDGGEIAETALDYLALDADGNVVYLGSYTEAYEAGQFVNAADAWLAGVNGTRGTLLPGDPQSASGPFTQVDVPGQETSTAEFVKITQSVCVPFDCYNDVLVIREGSEFKYYARGVGGIKTEPNDSGGEQEIEELINLTQLSSASLAEISAEALRLDEHARVTAERVFGDSQPAEQTP